MNISLDLSKTLSIAVVGSGVAGLSAAWLLGSRHNVTLFEANDYPGGHAHTVYVNEANTIAGASIPVDTGFIVYNEPNYPHLTALFQHLGVETRESDMSFSASIHHGAVEYAGDNLDTLFAQRSNLLRPSFLGMVGDMLRFNRQAKAILANEGAAGSESLGDFLNRQSYGHAFRQHYLLPMAAAIWSCPTATMLHFPVVSFMRFFKNHGLLDVVNRPLWRTVVGGSKSYVDKILGSGRFTLRLNTPVVKVSRRAEGVFINHAGERFDVVVFASHADQTLAMLDEADEKEMAWLGAFKYQANDAWLHSDSRLMPKRHKVWSSWNYLGYGSHGHTEAVAVSYWMNRLQGLPTQTPYFLTLNPPEPPAKDKVHGHYLYHHPVFDSRAMATQADPDVLQGHRQSFYCGSYFGYGFHEDALRSAIQVAARFGIQAPWVSP